MPIVRRAYVTAALVWLALLPLATFAATRVHASDAVHVFAFAIYSIGSLICHQRPERSFHVWGAQLPVCARCTGIYVGAALGLAYRSPEGSRAGRDSRVGWLGWLEREASAERVALVLAALPTAATLLFEWTTGTMPSNAVRFAAGLPLGAVVTWLVLVEGRVN